MKILYLSLFCIMLPIISSNHVNILAERIDVSFLADTDSNKFPKDNEIKVPDVNSHNFPEENELKPLMALALPDTDIGQNSNSTDELLEYATCYCKKLLVSSLGEAVSTQSQTLGVYQYYQEFDGHPSYYGPTNLHASNRLYYSKQYQGYILGDKLGSNVGFLYVPSAVNCPYMIPGGWQYYAGRWFVDTTLVVRCIPT